MPSRVTLPPLCDNIIFMPDNNGFSPATHFGKQVRKARKARGWSIHVLADKSGISAGHLSHIENGNRPPTDYIAICLDKVFPERQGWFLDYFHDSESWTPPGYRTWMEHERGARQIRAWSPGVLHGYVQTEDYARAWLAVEPGVVPEVLAARTTARMERQNHILHRENPPTVWLVVDELSLYRYVGSSDIMAAQLGHLVDVANLPDVTVQVLPAVAHPANASELIIADDAAYSEHIAGGVMHTEAETVAELGRRFNTIQAESLKASESIDLFERMRQAWIRGGKVPTPTVTADRASK